MHTADAIDDSSEIKIENVKDTVDDILKSFLKIQVKKARDQNAGYAELWEAIGTMIETGGKRMRPYLMMLSYSMYNGKSYNKVLSVAAAQELLHLSMLIHDDILDKDDVRYGIDNVSGQYIKKYSGTSIDVRHYATGAAILAGDVVLSSSYTMILNSDLLESEKVIACKYLGQAIFEVVGGELNDMESVLENYQDVDTFAVALNKTAMYSFVAPLVCGAHLAGAKEEELKKLRQFGINIGIAFQLVDDLLGVFGNPELTGKSVLSDIQEGKRTYLIQWAYLHASADQINILDTYYGNERTTEEEAVAVRNSIEGTGAVAATEERIAQYVAEAHAILDELILDQETCKPLHDLVTKVTMRNQ